MEQKVTVHKRANLSRTNILASDTVAGEGVDRRWGVLAKCGLVLNHCQDDQIVGAVTQVMGDKSTLCLCSLDWCGVGSSNHVMRAGVHKAVFDIVL